jgi:predicted HAD superfamily phosphohydrolase
VKKQLAELQKQQTNPDLTDEERDELQKQIDKLKEGVIDLEKLREEWVGKFFKLIPEEFRQFDGEFGVVDPDAQAEIVWKYIKTEIKEWMQNWYVKAWEKLISIFKKIWDLLGLDFLPIGELLAIMEMDIGALIEKNGKIQKLLRKDKSKN